MDAGLLRELNRLRAERRAAIVETDLETGETRLQREGEGDVLADELSNRFASGRSGTVEIDGRRLFLNVHLPAPRLLVIGAVHISQALAPMAAMAGFDVEIVDPRTAFATPERFEGVRLVADWPQALLAERPIDAYTAVAAVTHDPKIDDEPLVAALKGGAFYVGALGSRKTHAARLERLHAAGLDDAVTARIRAPIGLPIGAASPAEIAVSILAEIIAALRRRADGVRA